MGITVKHRGAADDLTGAERDITGRSYDVTVIGGGILGAMAAWRLSRYDLRILLIDRAYDLGEGAAKANSGILYPGFQPRGGSLKGISCVRRSDVRCDLQ